MGMIKKPNMLMNRHVIGLSYIQKLKRDSNESVYPKWPNQQPDKKQYLLILKSATHLSSNNMTNGSNTDFLSFMENNKTQFHQCAEERSIRMHTSR